MIHVEKIDFANQDNRCCGALHSKLNMKKKDVMEYVTKDIQKPVTTFEVPHGQ